MTLISTAGISRRTLLCTASATAAAACVTPIALGLQSAAEGPWRLLVNEAVTADLSISMLVTRYRLLADYMSIHIQSRQVTIDPIIDIRRFVQQAQSQEKPLVVFGKSVNQLSKLVRDHGYQPIVRRPEPYIAAFIVPKNSTIQSLGNLAGRKLLMPDESSATSAVAKAELRRMNVRDPFISHTRFQEMVASQVELGVAEAGVVNPTVAKKWRESGGRIIGETQPVVNWSVLASPQAPAGLVARLTESLLTMNNQSPAILTSIGVKQWVRSERKEYLALLDYTGE